MAYDSIDPEHIIASFGDYSGQPLQFGVKDNMPDPADVSVSTGLVKYELVSYDYYDGAEVWDRASLIKGLKVQNYVNVQGVVLFQLIDDRLLKVEIFPNKIANEVTDFTGNALIYVR